MEKIRVLHIDDKPVWAGGQSQLLMLYSRQLESRDIIPFIAVRKNSILAERVCRNYKDDPNVFQFSIRNDIDLPSYFTLYKIISRVKPHIIQCHTPHCIYAAFFMARLSGIKQKKRPKVIIVRRVDNPVRSIKKYQIAGDFIIAVSDNVHRSILERGYKKNNIKVIRDAVDKDRILQDSDKQLERLDIDTKKYADKVKIGSISQLIYHKGIDILIRAFSMVLREHDKVHLFIAGEGDQKRQLFRLVDDLDIKKHVSFLGFTDKPYGFIKFLDIIVFPSRTEGLCSTILDSLTLKTPIIASEAGGIPEMVKNAENGILFEPGDHADLSEKIKILLRDTHKGIAFAQKGFDMIPAWADLSYHAMQYEEVYKSLLK